MLGGWESWRSCPVAWDDVALSDIYILEFKERHVSEGRGPGTLLKLTRFERGCGRQRGVVAALGQTLNVAPLEILRPAVE